MLGDEVKQTLRSAKVSVQEAGGRARQVVANEILDAKNAIDAAVKKAGPNRIAQEAAEEVAKKEAVESLIQRAEPVARGSWVEKTPSALQRFTQRTFLLDDISERLAKDFQSASRSLPDFQIAPKRIKKLMKDADETLAIGRVQEAVAENLRHIPQGPDGHAMGQMFRQANDLLSRANGGEAMQRGHELVRGLAAIANGSGDELTRGSAQRAAQTLSRALTDDAWGEAGKLYGREGATPGTSRAPKSDFDGCC
jgi:hypothetical protein